ncbi:MAG: hypothetical protein BGO12_17350 [Verrucomicrobia bacterium 61-8]|nr:Verru_Chthon cassette protein A [Verrucomicrobiota bacterium]OJV24388.1 MAG: hypothetical protein BGO12_17350 [Verrucomicrobia bacterium 61-8]
MALVIVLGALVLITLLCVAFLASTNKELSASKSYASGVSARIYADAAVNVVLGQLRAATTVDDATQTWTSQPGLLRTFNDQGKQTQVFKLYSSDKMVDGSSFALASGGVPSDVPAWTSSTSKAQLPWNSSPGVYTDLNAPVTIDKKPSYPILNPGGLQAATRVQGFDVAANYGLPDSDDLDGDGNTSEIGQIPMPVRWLYVLKDGSLATAVSAGTKAVRLVLPNGNTVPDNNPPVARFAFWADDDTCRLNINTASEGTFWTLPVIAGADDSLSSGQVNAGEYQRYPGHPTATSLSPVLDFLTTNQSDLTNFIYSMSPRIAGRGSQAGSRVIGSGFPVENDNDRLYASVDELLFLPKYNGGTGQRYRMTTQNMKALKEDELDFKFTGTSQTSMAGSPYSFSSDFALDPDRLELIRFFLTVDSNAPEINLFGKPRVSLWPIDTRSDHQGTYDHLLAMCSTLDSSIYYFQRQNPASRTDDYDKITRNQTLLTYLDSLTATPIPGIGGSFSSKYPLADREQLLTSIFDWVRTVNLGYRDKLGSVKPYAWEKNAAADGTISPPGLPGSGQVLPIKIGSTSGYGRFPTLSKGALAIIREEELVGQPTPTQVTVKYRAVFLMETYVPMMGFAGYVPDYQIAVSGLAGGFDAVTEVPSISGSTIVTPLSFTNGSIEVNVPANVEPFTGRAWGGTQGFNTLFLYSDPGSNYQLSPRTIESSDSLKGYPFVSAQFQVIYPKTNSSGAAVKDTIRVGLRPAGGGASHTVSVKLQDMGGDTITSYDLPFPEFGPLDGAFIGDTDAAAGDVKIAPTLQTRVNQLADACKISKTTSDKDSEMSWTMKKNVIGSVDVIRGLELDHGDLRLLALAGTTPANKFVPHKDYANTAYPQAHSLLGAAGQVWATSNLGNTSPTATKAIRRGTLVNGTATTFSSGTPLNYVPQAPSQMTSVPAPGDFTTSLASEGDGPAILKADEGNSSFLGFNWGQSVRIPYQNQLFPWDDNLTLAFSPNRQVASAVQLGTLPSRAGSNTPWETLLFRPDIAPVAHPGAASPADSALLDLFWMPVVDPYPISRTFSTAGKVNMNCQIAPFTYIERTTALMGALKSVRVLAFPKEHAGYYKWSGYTVDASKSRWAISYLYDVDASQTLLFFKERFADSDPSKDVFQSASEICSVPLAPKQNTSSVIGTGHAENPPSHPISSVNIAGASDAGSLRAAIKSFWAKNSLTGDNAWEAPYNNLYPRLTTQSNTYTVYVKAQTIQVAPDTSLGNIPESRLRVTGEYRGSYDVERYLDSTDTSIPDFAQAANFSKTIYPYYKFRIKSSRQFLPQ